MTEMGRKALSPYLLFFLPPLGAVVLNLLLVVIPLVYEGMIIGAPPIMISGLDQWAAHVLLGIPLSEALSAYAPYISFLIQIYLLSFLLGFLIAVRLLWPTFRELLRTHEVISSEKRLAAKVLLDIIIFLWFSWLALTRILAYIMQYPWELIGVTPFSLLTGYIITGFITGGCIGKSIFPLWVYFTCRKHGLMLISICVEQPDSRIKAWHRDRIVKWALVPTRRQRR